jgi:dipeptidyl aminopeptidase/acylaminoacyl peptidase
VGGVVGGGFRSTSRVTVGYDHTDSLHGVASNVIGFTWESFHTQQQGYLQKFSISGTQATAVGPSLALTNFSSVPAGHVFAAASTVQWASDDGHQVEGILLRPPGSAAAQAPQPLIVFTHCGPAMAVLQTFIGYGSVCARFPLEIWAEQGYTVLMPNYRGSTGYGTYLA